MNLKTSLLALLTLVLLLNCNKRADTRLSPSATVDRDILTSTVSGWMGKAIIGRNGQPSPRITELKQSLMVEKLSYARLSNQSLLIVVPMKASFKALNNVDSLKVTYFTLLLDESGKVSKAQIVQYLSAPDNLAQLDDANLATMLEKKESKLDGSFFVLAPNGRYLYDLQFKGGKLAQQRTMVTQKATGESARIGDCYDYYYFIYIIHSDGSWEYHAQYITTICEGGCSATGPGGTGSLCDEFTSPEDGGTGGGGPAPNCNGQITNYLNAVNLSTPDSDIPIEIINSDDGVTRTVTEHWKCLQGGGGTWSVESIESGTKIWNAARNRWEWSAIQHLDLQVVGTVPAGVNVYLTGSGSASIHRFGASVDVQMNITYFFVNNCPNTPIAVNVNPVVKTYSSSASFSN